MSRVTCFAFLILVLHSFETELPFFLLQLVTRSFFFHLSLWLLFLFLTTTVSVHSSILQILFKWRQDSNKPLSYLDTVAVSQLCPSNLSLHYSIYYPCCRRTFPKCESGQLFWVNTSMTSKVHRMKSTCSWAWWARFFIIYTPISCLALSPAICLGLMQGQGQNSSSTKQILCCFTFLHCSTFHLLGYQDKLQVFLNTQVNTFSKKPLSVSLLKEFTIPSFQLFFSFTASVAKYYVTVVFTSHFPTRPLKAGPSIHFSTQV